ncbi:DUF2975 domain-containing protein [Subsaximicrobium wynnwilliamsii]|uniref:DUF2975 domain-containing protein n=1 Tax=Subsaximicrobium wynnwilliamsii TaxID=291179 RepID=A0A5C6ZFU9_9FLAO|nr:DUF2975 domain-containing protein [Subsaximicrobium wynnwilliamsii]TXD82504.1 DUF2975 domain-containing protein [Subsaximicrobium wynnwilliamsii]TXD88147.1 DUF2975 domain-containing protein [Subsaximicrobium wynnwilliamsii]TXE02162.1 DUF2975 domain-containing protein [Subsaximicrobium wynnwilliamsii]
MKKLKFLNGFVIGLMALFVLIILVNLYIGEISNFGKTLKGSYDQVVFGQWTPYLYLLFYVPILVALLYIQRGLMTILKDNLFNIKSAKRFKIASTLLFITGVFGLIFDSILFLNLKGVVGFGYLGQDVLILFIGIILNIVADIIVNGSSLKTENELTI